ncbi:DNA topoisomerase IV subunit B [Methylotenera sp.]|uniref:DNA topoisomerase IV subunit B n=1 Tax=Methylotenera sp. TaxID=2051956 RepID=UPI0025CEB366|nr:DNA topoisomerase IV subunit B [Methylotenera sp.]
MSQDNKKQDYSANNIKVLVGLEPVKKRPGMYTRTESPTHIIQEVLDNAADEALAGYAKHIDLIVYKNGSIEVRDDGRGIPTGIPAGQKLPAVELVFTQLHAGGKFEGDAYKFSGGLHGVGVSVTNALSTRLEVEVKRHGEVYQIVFVDGGKRESALKVIGACGENETGTKVVCWPDAKYFHSPDVSMNELEHLVRSKAVLMPGVSMRLMKEISHNAAIDPDTNEANFVTTEDGRLLQVKSWSYPGGFTQYMEEQYPDTAAEFEVEDSKAPIPVITGEMFVENGEGAAWAITFRPGAGGRGESYVNLIPTLSGGTHEAGFRNGIFDAIRSFADHHALMPRGIKLSAEDCWSSVNFLLSSSIKEPEFQGQTKEKLSNRDALKLTTNATYPILESWLNQNPELGKRIADMSIRAATIRSKSIQKVEKKKTSGISILPDKLSDCELAGTMEAEVFLVEGDSAGGSAKMGRDRERQAILPVKGKILNSWHIDQDTILASKEVHDVFQGIGINPHNLHNGKESDLAGLRYGKVCILSDADVDGSHIQVLFLTLFIRHAPDLIRQGRLYIAMPPLYRIDAPAKGKGKPEQKFYVADEREKAKTLSKLMKEGFQEHQLTVQRFKGLGEMNPDQLWETTLCPDTRRLVKVVMSEDEMTETLATFDMMMSSSESGQRKEWMEAKGHLVEADI